MKKYLIFTILIIISCIKAGEQNGGPYKGDIRRIVSLSPNMTEILYSLDILDRVCGVTVDCDYPLEVKKIKKLGKYTNPDMELIYSLKPDIILYTGTGSPHLDDKFKSLGIRIFHHDINSFKDLFYTIERVGEILNIKENSNKLRDELKSGISEIKNKDYNSGKTVYGELWYPPAYSIGKNSFINEIFMLLGLKNVTGHINNPYPVIDWEFIVQENPDIMVVFYDCTDLNLIKKRKSIQKIDFFKNSNIIYNFNFSLVLRPGPRILSGIKELEQILIKKNLIENH